MYSAMLSTSTAQHTYKTLDVFGAVTRRLLNVCRDSLPPCEISLIRFALRLQQRCMYPPPHVAALHLDVALLAVAFTYAAAAAGATPGRNPYG